MSPDFQNIYAGNFSSVTFERDDPKFVSLANGYMESYWDICKQYLTQDRTRIMTQECTGGYAHWVNGYGVQTSPDTCQGWSTVPTGKWADRQLYDAVSSLEGQAQKNLVGNTISSVLNGKSLGDMFSKSLNGAAEIAGASKQAGRLIEMNECTSPALLQFQRNLLQFAEGGEPMQPGRNASQQRLGAASQAGVSTNVAAFLEDVVKVQSKSWIMNQYVPDTITAVEVVARDARNSPAKVTASYRFQGFGGASDGSLTLTFQDGRPSCVYYYDQPGNCVPPPSRLIQAYMSGLYR